MSKGMTQPQIVLGEENENERLVQATYVDQNSTTLGPVFLLDERAIPGERDEYGKLVNRVLTAGTLGIFELKK